MAQYYGMTPEMYRAVTALVDDRIKEIMVARQDFDRLAEAQIRAGDRLDRVEAALDRLAEAQARTEEQIKALTAAQARTEEQMKALTAAQTRTEERLIGLEAAMEKLAEAQARTEEQMKALTAAQARTEERLTGLEAAMEKLAEAQTRTEETIARMLDTLGDLKGRSLERDYRDKAYAYFGALLRRVRVVSLQELEEGLEPYLSEQQLDDLRPLDLLVSGRPRQRPDAPEVWLAVEISARVNRYDVERAQRRAAALRRAGYRTIPVIAGEQVAAGVEDTAREGKVLLLQDGRAQFWTEALEEALAL